MNIPVDGVIISASGVASDESAMTGESDEQKKDTLEKCLEKVNEKRADARGKEVIFHSHDFPSPVLLSGTTI